MGNVYRWFQEVLCARDRPFNPTKVGSVELFVRERRGDGETGITSPLFLLNSFP